MIPRFISKEEIQVGDTIAWSNSVGLYYGTVDDIDEWEYSWHGELRSGVLLMMDIHTQHGIRESIVMRQDEWEARSREAKTYTSYNTVSRGRYPMPFNDNKVLLIGRRENDYVVLFRFSLLASQYQNLLQ